MKIALDARWIFSKISGVGTYTVELIRALSHLDRENQYLLLFDHNYLLDRTSQETQFNNAPNFQPKPLNYGPLSLMNQWKLPRFLREHEVEIYHSPNYLIPLRCFPRERAGRTKCITTIHDVIPLLFRDHAPKSRKARAFPIYKKLMQEIGARSDTILTVSDCSRNDVIHQLDIAPGRHDRVVRIYNGVNPHYKPDFGYQRNGPPTILFVGRPDPYKNLGLLIEALHTLHQNGIEAKLRIIGPEDPRYPEPFQRARELGIQPHVEWSGYLSDDGLLKAYQQADVFVLPSRYEGFGLPVLEAMACGTPVVCSNCSSLPEVAGDAAILVEPDNEEALTFALTRVLTLPEVARELSQKGLARSAEFTWQETAKQTLEAYEKTFRDDF